MEIPRPEAEAGNAMMVIWGFNLEATHQEKRRKAAVALHPILLNFFMALDCSKVDVTPKKSKSNLVCARYSIYLSSFRCNLNGK